MWAAEATGFDKSLWERLCAMGATTMALPESSGGDGATLVDLTLVAEELGRVIAPVPWIDQSVPSGCSPGWASAIAEPGQRRHDWSALDPRLDDARRRPAHRRPGRSPTRSSCATATTWLRLTFATRPAKVDNIGRLPMAWIDPADADSRYGTGQPDPSGGRIINGHWMNGGC